MAKRIIYINTLDSPTYDSGANQQFRFRLLDQYKADIGNLLKQRSTNHLLRKSAFSLTINLDPKKKV
jgi:hypothetical protein